MSEEYWSTVVGITIVLICILVSYIGFERSYRETTKRFDTITKKLDAIEETLLNIKYR